jgi:non-heme chloroperoxidase
LEDTLTLAREHVLSTEDLKIINVPMLVMHGDDDQIVPIADSALLSRAAISK